MTDMVVKIGGRPDWDTYFMYMAHLVSTRATCDRKKVGAVIVDKDRRIVATGYNGSPAGKQHCDDVGHLLKDVDGRASCIRTLHAESNAIDQAGTRARGCTMYVTVIPCYDCAKRILNAGVDVVYYGEYYESRNSKLVREHLGTVLKRFGEDYEEDETSPIKRQLDFWKPAE